MDSGLRAEVARRVWIGLCVLECCTFVCIPIINALAATIYLKLWNLNIVSWAVKHEVPEVFWVFAAVELVWSTFLYGILRRGSTIQTEMRLRLFLFTAFLGGTVWALIIVVALCRGSCASNAVDRVQVSLKEFRAFDSDRCPESNGCSEHDHFLHLFPGPKNLVCRDKP